VTAKPRTRAAKTAAATVTCALHRALNYSAR
jgi:hypothetical protein